MDEPLSWAQTVRLVHERASGCCEYCYTCQRIIAQSMHVDHILPDGGDHPDNLALACPLCNLSKSSFTEGIDPETGEVFPLFNPRIELWRDHFTWIDAGCRIRGMTPTGRVTVERLRLNRDQVVVARSLWVKAGLHPPFIPGLAE